MAEEKPAVNGVEVADNSLLVPLRKPIMANGEQVSELRFREPTAADIERCGSPVHFDTFSGEMPKMTYEPKAMFAMMSTLAAVPPSTIRSMNTKDWEYAALMLAHRFFLPD
jgi:Phage tail assembly chaperone proteins, E, or 41 or 14